MSGAEFDAAELADLRAAVAGLDAEPAPGFAGAPAAPAAPAVDALESCRAVCQVAAGLVRMVWPVLSYPPEVIDEAAQQLEPLTRRPWFQAWFGGAELVGRWGPEINAGMFFGALVASSVRKVRESKNEGAAQQPQAAEFGGIDNGNPFAAAAPAGPAG